MDTPKPHPPGKKMMPTPGPSEKKPYVRRDHLSQKPFTDHDGLKELQKKMNSPKAEYLKRIQRGEK